MTTRALPRGVVDAHGLLVPARDPGAARALVLAWWHPGSVVYETPFGWWLRWPVPRRLGEPHPATPILADHGAFRAAADVSAAAHGAGPGDLLVRHHGAVHLLRAADLTPLDPASWLHPGVVTVLETVEHRPPPPPPESAPSPVRRDEWAPAADAPVRELLDDLAAGRTPTPPPAAVPEPPPAGWWRRLTDRVGLTRATPSVPPDAAAAWKRHLDATDELFRRGDLDAALRRALPLTLPDGRPVTALLERPPPPRDKLSPRLSPAGPPAAAPVDRSDTELVRLRDRYLQAARTLEAAGRISEAAFVWSDLLDDPTAAVDVLERHGDLPLAARLAETRGLPPGRVVALWWLAGSPDDALRVAAVNDAWDEALRLLRASPDHGTALRLRYADVLLEAGRPAAAARLLADLPPERRSTADGTDRYATLVLRLVTHGGPAGVPFLPDLRDLDPNFPVENWIDAVLEAPEQLAARVALVRLDRPDLLTPSQRRRLALAVLPFAAEPRLHTALAGLAQSGDEPALGADWPAAPPLTATRGGWDADDLAPGRCEAAVVTADGRHLLALGEGGVALLHAHGGVAHRFQAPAEHLVLGAEGLSAFALARRDGRWQVTPLRLDPPAEGPTLDLDLHAWARTADPKGWLVAVDSVVSRVQIPRPGFWRLVRVRDAGGPVAAVFEDVPDATHLAVHESGAAGRALWRELRFAAGDTRHVIADAPVDESCRTSRGLLRGDLRAGGLHVRRPNGRTHVEQDALELIDADENDTHLVVVVRTGDGLRALVLSPTLEVHGRWELRGAQRARVQAGADGWVTLADDLGRVLSVPLVGPPLELRVPFL